MSTPVSAAGTYSDCHLAHNVTVSAGTGTTLTINGPLDLNGFELRDTTTGNAVSFGVVLNTAGARIYDSKGGGKITGFWAGVKSVASSAQLINCDLSGNRYFGAYIDTGANNNKITGGKIGSINGVTNEAYAIGIQAGNVTNLVVDGVVFENMYRQTAATSAMVGEGLPVNFSSSSTNCVMKNCVAINTSAKPYTIGAFAGVLGGHTIENNTFINFVEAGVMTYSSAAAHNVVGNTIWLKEPTAGSRGAEGHNTNFTKNLIVGYDVSQYGNATFSKNTILEPHISTSAVRIISQIPYESVTTSVGTSAGPDGFGVIFSETPDTAMGPWTPANTYVSVLDHARFGTMPGGTPTTIKVKIAAGPSGFASDGFYVGHKATSGDIYDFAATPVQLSVSGNTTFSIAGNGEAWAIGTFVYDKSSGLDFALQDQGTGGNDLKAKVAATAIYKGFYKAGKDASTVNKSGYSHLGGSDPSNKHTFIKEIQIDGF